MKERTKIVTEKTRLEELPKSLQAPIWEAFHGLNFYNMARSTMKSLGDAGYKIALTYIGKTIIKNEKVN